MRKKSAYGWLELLLGIIFVAFGVFTFARPEAALSGLVAIYGFAAVVSGIVDIILYIYMERRLGLGPVVSLAGGIAGVAFGVLLLFNVGAGVLAVSIMFPLWFIVHCTVRLVNIGFIKATLGSSQFYLSLVLNIAGAILGLALILNPFASAASLSYIIAAYLIALGMGSIIMACGRLGS